VLLQAVDGQEFPVRGAILLIAHIRRTASPAPRV
jgi:hypothetical protein